MFAAANDALDHLGLAGDRYDIQLVAATAESFESSSGLRLEPARVIEDITPGEIDTLVVPGGDSVRSAGVNHELIAWIAEIAPTCRRVASVCTGTFLLADAGICAGRRVTTHWAHAGSLAKRHPDVTVDPDPIYLRDGDLWTSAGVTAGIDLALALVEADCGASVAQLVARHLVVYLRRPGGQSQFATPVWSEPTEVAPIRAACDLIHQRPEGAWTVADLAAEVGVSERHFTRLFRAEVGESPGRYLDRVRVEAARAILETEPVGLDVVARRCGFGSSETLRRAFHRRLGVSPAAYRRQTGVPT